MLVEESPKLKLQRSLPLIEQIQKRSLFGVYLLGCFKERDKAKKYRKMIKDSTERIKESLDLQKLIEEQQFTCLALNVLMNARQAKIVKGMSKLKLEKQTSSLDVKPQDSSEFSHPGIESAELQFSADKVDRRLFGMIHDVNKEDTLVRDYDPSLN